MLELTSALAWVAEQRRSDGGDSDRLLALVLDGLRPPRDLHPNVTADG